MPSARARNHHLWIPFDFYIEKKGQMTNKFISVDSVENRSGCYLLICTPTMQSGNSTLTCRGLGLQVAVTPLLETVVAVASVLCVHGPDLAVQPGTKHLLVHVECQKLTLQQLSATA